MPDETPALTGIASRNALESRVDGWFTSSGWIPFDFQRDFLTRVKGARFWQLSNRDSAQWDLGPDGAKARL